MTPDGCYGDPRNHRLRHVRIDEANAAALPSPGMDASEKARVVARMKMRGIDGYIRTPEGSYFYRDGKRCEL